MTLLQKIYLLRIALGITAAFICAGFGMATEIISNSSEPFFSTTKFPLTAFFNSMSIAIIVYIISYYIFIKPKFMLSVDKPQKLFTTGIGIYFISWLVFWILLYTIIAVA